MGKSWRLSISQKVDVPEPDGLSFSSECSQNKMITFFSILIKLQISCASDSGAEPKEFMCKISQCGNYTDYSSLVDDKSLFGRKNDGSPDYCKMEPLVENFYKSKGLCSQSSFNMSAPKTDYCHGSYENLYVAPFEMEQSVVTEFGLFCDKELLVSFKPGFFLQHFCKNSTTKKTQFLPSG